MKTVIIITSFFIILCTSDTQAWNRVWSVEQVIEWYNENCMDPETTWCSNMYYQGSNEKFHFFTIRNFESWVTMKIRIKELSIENVMPKFQPSQKEGEKRKMGHYIVDPMNEFKEIVK